MKIAAAAYQLTEQPNINAWSHKVEGWCGAGAQTGADVLLFPEYASLELGSMGGVATPEDIAHQLTLLEHYLPIFRSTYQNLARVLGKHIVAPSIPVQVEGKWVNRAYAYGPTGVEGYQDKWFITPFEKTDLGIESGEKTLTVFETSVGNFGIQICYDGEFAIGSRLLALAGADIILIPSATETSQGAERVHLGARARAMENQCYTMVSQTIGEAPFSTVVDLNYGYCGAYATPDLGFPTHGILQESVPQSNLWMMQEFDFGLLPTVRENGAVRNYVDGMAVNFGWKDGSPITVNRVKLS
jgi:predicted amidohydrolase